MSAKRALIVDDSKSARLFLARALEKYDVDVDNAESAEAAIEYLGHNHPDVIFMDHLMPGMDGLQAVQAIKNDPRTATIPIMMYTSQEGELFLGQARALGAVGVLPKQIRPTDVSKVLYQLHLVPDRRTTEQSTFTPRNVRVEGVQGEPVAAVYSEPLTDSTLREHFAELRRALIAAVDTQTTLVTAEVRALLLESPPPLPPGAPVPPRTATAPAGWVVAGAALAMAVVSSALWWRTVRVLDNFRVELTEFQERQAQTAPHSAAATTVAETAQPSTATPRTLTPSDVKPMVVAVPYGADALGGARLEAIGKLLYRLARQKVTGVVDIRTFAGRFCLVGNALDGYSVAPEGMLYSKCDVVGNPSDDALTGSQRTPLALANLIGDIRSTTGGALQVRVAVGDAGSVLASYPPVVSGLTADEWNRSGSANNRVEIGVH